MLWGVLRSAPRLFSLPGGLAAGSNRSGGSSGASEEERAMLKATQKLASALSECYYAFILRVCM